VTDPAPYPDFDGTQACYGRETELFFPVGAGEETHEALRICDSCTWRRPCLAYALTHDVHGIWGGTTRPTRAEIRREHGIRAVSVQIAIPEPPQPASLDDNDDPDDWGETA
jgi:hypothetical protein